MLYLKVDDEFGGSTKSVSDGVKCDTVLFQMEATFFT